MAAKKRRTLSRRKHTPAQLDAAAKVQPGDIERAADTYRRDAPRHARDWLDVPDYTGDERPSDTSRDP